MSKRIIITGGAGYLGSLVALKALQKGYTVDVIDSLEYETAVPLLFAHHPAYTFHRVNLLDMESLSPILSRGGYLIHAAALVGETACERNPDRARKINYEVTKTLIERAVQYRLSGFLFLSTCSNYGIMDGVADEQSPVIPLSLYAETKIASERCIQETVQEVPWIIARMATLYGPSPRMRFDLTVNDFVVQTFFKGSLELYDAETFRPYIHVHDASEILLALIENIEQVRSETVNIGFSDENFQKREIAMLVQARMPAIRIMERNSKTVDPRNYRVDFSKLSRMISQKKTYSVSDGIRQLIDICRQGIVANWEDTRYRN